MNKKTPMLSRLENSAGSRVENRKVQQNAELASVMEEREGGQNRVKKVCIKCGASKPASDFYNNKGSKDGTRSSCKDCCKEASRSWKLSNPDKVKAMRKMAPREKRAEYQKRYRAKYPHKFKEAYHRERALDPRRQNARHAVRRAINRGDLTRPTVCQKCGASGCAIEASHNDYAFALRVEWLCVSCHRRKDMARNRKD